MELKTQRLDDNIEQKKFTKCTSNRQSEIQEEQENKIRRTSVR
jgi:hypothetical protein